MSAYIITWVSNNGSVDDGVERAKEKKFGGKSQVCIKFLGNFLRSSFQGWQKLEKSECQQIFRGILILTMTYHSTFYFFGIYNIFQQQCQHVELMLK